jgi:Alpha-lytic protease prodomain
VRVPGTAWAVDVRTDQVVVTADSTVSGSGCGGALDGRSSNADPPGLLESPGNRIRAAR